MKPTCEICGRELGFFERKQKAEDQKLGFSYHRLCSNCHRNINLGVNKINAICEQISNELLTEYSKYSYASNNIDVLIFLSVKAIFEKEPNYNDPDGLLLKVFYPERNHNIRSNFDYLIEITYKVLRNRFSYILGRYGLDTFENFSGYMSRTCLFFRQQLCNCGPDGKFIYADIFVCQAGFIFYDPKNLDIKTLFVSQDRTLRYSLDHLDATYNFKILKQRYHKTKILPIISFIRKDQRKRLIKEIETYNNQKIERIESELNALIDNLNVNIEKNLREMHPNDSLKDIPLDSVLVSIINTLYEEDIDQEFVTEAPDGLVALIIERFYMDNFIRSGLSDVSEVQDYITDECIFISDFRAAMGKEKPASAFAFLTPKAYMIKQLNGNVTFLNGVLDQPNELYCDFQDIIYEGKPEFYITTATSNKSEDGFYFLTGIRINSKNKKAIEEFRNYFSRKSLDYYEQELRKERKKISEFYEDDLSNAARNIFIGFGYLPFCLYDEWASIEENIRKSDLLMEKLIPEREKKTSSKGKNVFYASKTVNSFEQQAARLAEDLEFTRLPVVRALLWDQLKKEIIEICSQEFIRLCGDIVKENDSLRQAFIKYSKLDSIDTEKAYYLGLFIYYLMSKGVLEKTDFLDHFNEAAKLYIKINPERTPYIDFSELNIPEKRAFNADAFDFSSFNAEVEKAREESKRLEDSFLFSVKTEEGDTDSADSLAQELEEQAGIDHTNDLEILKNLVDEEDDIPESESIFTEVNSTKEENLDYQELLSLKNKEEEIEDDSKELESSNSQTTTKEESTSDSKEETKEE